MPKQITIYKPGGYEALCFESAASVLPVEGECLVEIRYIGVNYADVIVREGYYAAAKDLDPLVPGFEFSGIIKKVGKGKAPFKVGDEVCGITRFGAYCSEICVPYAWLIPLPQGWSLSQAAGLLVPHLTAYYALQRVAHVEKGERVLVHSAAGGVGSALMQQAQAMGCKTYGVVGSAAKVAAVQGKPAHVFVKSITMWADIDAQAPEGFDVIFDANGVTTPREGIKRLRTGGRLVVYGFAELFPRGGKPNRLKLLWQWLKIPRISLLALPSRNITIAGFNIVYLFKDEALIKHALQQVRTLANQGVIAKPKVKVFEFADVVAAHRLLESGQSVGRIVLRV